MTRIYEFIHSEEGNYPIAWMCQWAGVSKSGYHATGAAGPNPTPPSGVGSWPGIFARIFDESDGTYGYRRIAATLDWQGVPADVDTVRSIMRELGLRAARPRRKVRTTVPAQDLDERPDLVRRDFTADAPGVKWVGDIPPLRGRCPHLHSHLGGVRVPGHRSGLLYEEGGGVCVGGSYAHRPGVPGD